MPGSFADSNVLLYLFTDGDTAKAAAAEQVLMNDLTISVQVLNEVAKVLKRQRDASWTRVHEALAAIKRLTTILPLTRDVHERGVAIAERYRLNVYDAMIVSAALLRGCDTLYSEDMHNGLVVDGQLRIVNPFA